MTPFMVLSFLFCVMPLFFQVSHSITMLVDGVTEWKNPSVQVGDSIVFEHKYHYNLYIFKNQRAFNLCNFTQATFLNKPNSTSFTWHPSRTGFFYFTFNNGSLKTCQGSQMLAVKVSAVVTPPPIVAPAPASSGTVSSNPSFPWPFRPHEANSPSPSPEASSRVNVPSLLPEKGGTVPFINSNPAVPLPTGEVDSATIGPIATTSNYQNKVVVDSLLQAQMALFCVAILML